MTTQEERRIAKQAAWRASQGLPPKGTKPKTKRITKAARDNREADRIDGYNRDDIGLSPDY